MSRNSNTGTFAEGQITIATRERVMACYDELPPATRASLQACEFNLETISIFQHYAAGHTDAVIAQAIKAFCKKSLQQGASVWGTLVPHPNHQAQ